MDYSESLFADISSVPAPEGWISTVCAAESGFAKYLQLDYLPGSAHITVKLDVAQTYAAVCGLTNSKEYSSTDILNLFSNGTYVEMSNCPNFNCLNSCMFYSGFSKAGAPENGSAFSILIAHHDNMIAEVRLVVTPTIDNSALHPANEWLHTNAVQKYLDDVSNCLASSCE